MKPWRVAGAGLNPRLVESFHPTAYVEPFESGFDLANHGAIIPVHATPGKNLLEVWWFRKNQMDVTRGFRNTFWPAVIARYATAWPVGASEIILASNDGSGALPSLEAKGTIYSFLSSTNDQRDAIQATTILVDGQNISTNVATGDFLNLRQEE